MPRGANSKREREYKELKQEFCQEGRYPGREEEVAARIVNQQRAQYGETKPEKAEEKAGQSPDRELPIAHYRKQTIPQICSALESLSASELKQVRDYEAGHKHRKTLLAELERELASKGE